MDPPKDWKEEQKTFARYAYVKLINKTGHTLFRQLSEITWGAWSFFPPERIGPNTTSEFGSHSNIFVTGTEAFVTYKTTSGASFLIKWGHPFFTNPWNQITTSKQFKIIVTDKRKKINMKNFGCDFEFTVMLNTESSPIMDNKLDSDDPHMINLRKAQEETKKLEQISELQRNISNSKRSVFISVKNNTKINFTRSQHTLLQGEWLCEPPQEFPSQSTIEFGTKNKDSMSGTSGVVQYGFKEGKSDLKFSWDNPFFEKSIFNKNGPLEFSIETKQAINRNHAELIYVINERVVDEKEDIQENKDNDLLETLKFRVFSYNTHLLPPGQTIIDDPIRRAKLIADSITKASNTDDPNNCRGNFAVVCLQDVYYNPCKEILEQNLKVDFPHIATRFGKYNSGTDLDSGLFFASKHKIEKIDFHRFENGIGSDSEKDKGVLVVKLDVSALRENSFVYILNTNLQSNPDSSLGWKTVQNKKQSAKKVREAQLLFIKKIIDNIVSEEKTKMKNNSIILCGTFNVTAEKIILDTRTEWMENQLVPSLSVKFSDENFLIGYALEFAKLIEADGLKEYLLGKLRAKVTSSRSRALLLVIIINLIIKEKIWNEFSKEYNNSDSEEKKGKLYLSVCLKYLNAITQGEDIDDKYKLPSDPFAHKKKQTSTGNTSPSMINFKPEKLIWTDDLIERIESKFPGALSESEKSNFQMLKHQVLPFQQFKHLSELLLLSWSPQVELQVIEGNKVLEDNDIFDVNLKSLFTQYANAKKLTKSESVDLQITPEYDSMMEILGSPVDLFRDLNPNIVGTTTECHHLSIKKPKRTDYIFQYKKVKRDDNSAPKEQQQPVNPLLGNLKSNQGELFVFRTVSSDSWALHTFNSSEDLSTHQALSVLCYPFGISHNKSSN